MIILDVILSDHIYAFLKTSTQTNKQPVLANNLIRTKIWGVFLVINKDTLTIIHPLVCSGMLRCTVRCSVGIFKFQGCDFRGQEEDIRYGGASVEDYPRRDTFSPHYRHVDHLNAIQFYYSLNACIEKQSTLMRGKTFSKHTSAYTVYIGASRNDFLTRFIKL